MLDPDPHKTDADPKHWYQYSENRTLNANVFHNGTDKKIKHSPAALV
jgi:hypothetical protein